MCPSDTGLREFMMDYGVYKDSDANPFNLPSLHSLNPLMVDIDGKQTTKNHLVNPARKHRPFGSNTSLDAETFRTRLSSNYNSMFSTNRDFYHPNYHIGLTSFDLEYGYKPSVGAYEPINTDMNIPAATSDIDMCDSDSPDESCPIIVSEDGLVTLIRGKDIPLLVKTQQPN